MKLHRRDLFKMGGAALIGSQALKSLSAFQKGGSGGGGTGEDIGSGVIEVFPTSPFILNPFNDPLTIPAPLKPVDVSAFGSVPPDPSKHQLWPGRDAPVANLPSPIFYQIKIQVAAHSFTSSLVQPINALGQNVIPPGAANTNPFKMPDSTIYGFNGTFPGSMI